MAACLLLAAICLLFFWPVLAGGVLLPIDGIYLIDPAFAPYRPAGVPQAMNLVMVADLVGCTYVYRQFTAESLGAGHVPLWNPYSACGMPFLANDQSAVLNPPNLLSNLLLPPHLAQTVFSLFCLIAAGIFTYGLTRSLGAAPVGGILGGLTFAFGGFVLVWLGLPLAATAIVLPALLWATRCLAIRPTLIRAVVLGGLLGWQFLSGHLSTSVHMLAFWIAFVVYEIVSLRCPTRIVSRGRLVGAAALALFLGVALGAPQLLPLREYVGLGRLAEHGRSRWAADSTADSVRKGLLGDTWFLRRIAPGELALLFVPERHGNPAFDDYRPHPDYGNYPERTSYVGAAALLALLSGIVWLPSRGHRRFFLIAGCLTLGVLLHLPVLNLVTYLPVLRLAAPQRLRFVFALCAAVSLGLAVSRWLPDDHRGERQRGRPTWLIALGILIVCTLLGAGALSLLCRPRGEALPQAVGLLRIIKLFAPAAAAAALVFLVSRRIQARLGRAAVAIMLVGVVAADLLVFAARWQSTARPENVLPALPPIQAIRELAGQARITGPPNLFRPNLSVGYGIYDARSYDPLAVERFVRLVEGFHGQVGESPWLAQGSETPIPELNRLTSVKYLWRFEPGGDLAIQQSSSALPRAYLTTRVRSCSADAALDALTSGLDPFLETPIEGPSAISNVGNDFFRRASLVSYAPHRVVVSTSAEQACWLVLTDTYYPGWKASVNGRRVPISIANYAFRGVPVPAGESVVIFAYEPTSYRVGVFVGLVGIAIALMLCTAQIVCGAGPRSSDRL